MELVIDIPEEDIPKNQEIIDISLHFIAGEVCECNYPYIVIPKGHGRILDEKDILDTENNDGGWYDLVDMPEYIAGVKAIIEADKGESEVSDEDSN